MVSKKFPRKEKKNGYWEKKLNWNNNIYFKLILRKREGRERERKNFNLHRSDRISRIDLHFTVDWAICKTGYTIEHIRYTTAGGKISLLSFIFFFRNQNFPILFLFKKIISPILLSLRFFNFMFLKDQNKFIT